MRKQTWIGVVAGLVTTPLLSGCVGSSTPRKPRPPAQLQATAARAVVDVRGLPDTQNAQRPFLEGLRRTAGVKGAQVDEATGDFVIDYDPRRITRETIRRRIRELGRDQLIQVEPIFADR